jgi:hypothetical protein
MGRQHAFPGTNRVPRDNRSFTVSVLFCSIIVAMSLVIPPLAGAEGSVQRAPEKGVATVPGKFVAWRNSNEVVTLNGNTFSVLNIQTLSSEVIPNRAPDPNDLKLVFAASSESIKPFPGRIINKLSAGGEVVWWLVNGMTVGKGPEAHVDATFAPSSKLIDPSQGEIAIYFSPKGQEANEEPGVKAADRRASFSVVHRKGTHYQILPLEFDPAIAQEVLNSGYRWWNLTSQRDEVSGKYLLFFSKEVFLYSAKQYGGAGWSPFNVWWLNISDDARADAIEHISLPKGPWIDDAKSDGPIRRLLCTPFECDFFRSYEFKAAGLKVFVRIFEFRNVLSRDTLGTYVLDASARTWLKVGDADVNLNQVSPDGCAVAINDKQHVEIDNLCLAPRTH